MIQRFSLLLWLGCSLFWSGCYTHFVRQQGQYLSMDGNLSTDSLLSARAIQPYKQQIDAEMNTVICQSVVGLTKMQPESTMGNWAADAVRQKASDYSGQSIDFAIINYGGLRVLSMPQGNITKGHIFEVMPFDNLVVIIEMKGSDLQPLFDHIAANSGWPLSAGVRMTIREGKASNISIGGKPIETDRIYTIATNDYLANGGDKCLFFTDKKRIETGKLLRDAVIEYCIALQQAGKSIDYTLEGRITEDK